MRSGARMKALIGVSSLTDVAPSDVIREMERLAERALRENGFALTECEHGVHVDSPSPCKVCGAQ